MGQQLILIPSFIGEGGADLLSKRSLEVIFKTRFFIVEREKTARAFLKAIGHPIAQQEFQIHELDKHGGYDNFRSFIDEHSKEHNIGIISEAGLPAVADPGSAIVKYGHQLGLRIVPLSGSSSIFLALMASGMNGQKFSFNGYLPIDPIQRLKKLKEMEKRCNSSTQIFMETPYRNNDFLAFLVKNLGKETRLCVASQLESPEEAVISKKVKNWKAPLPDYHKKPCMYLIGA